MHPTRHKLLSRLAALFLTFSIVPIVSASDWNYHVRPHDNLRDLSIHYMKPDVPWQKLQGYNKVADPDHLPPGLVLHLPIAWLRAQPVNAQVVAVIGNAHVQRPGQTHSIPVTSGMALGCGTHLSTDANASLTLQFADGSRVLMEEHSELDLDQMSAYGNTGMVDTRLRLQHGRVSNAVTPMTGAAAHFSVETPEAISTVRGTHFRVVDNDGHSQTDVLTGRVDVAIDHAHVLVQAGRGEEVADGFKPPRPKPLLHAPTLHCSPQPLNQRPHTFAWAALGGAKSYRVQMAPNDRFEALLLDHVTSTTRISLPDVPDGDYAVRVHGIDSSELEGEDGVACMLHIGGHP
ncbi:MAG TPA: FecR domain-containing protein [Rhodanobacter sp.]|jgi:hypothetical protein|nr:FecR domain-containing protein [Rhodanobacter sp.]